MGEDTQSTIAEALKLSPSALIELVELDATPIDSQAGIFSFCNGTLPTGNNLVWQGKTYSNYGFKSDGFEFKSQGELPRPKIQFSNLFSSFTALNINYADLVGAVIRRRRIFYRFLDTHIGGVPPNPDGTYSDNPDANPNAGWPIDVFYLHQKTNQTKLVAEYEMSSVLELENVQFPLQQVMANLCQSLYRSTECSYTGPIVADIDGNPVPVPLGQNKGLWTEGVQYNVGDYVNTKLNPKRKLKSVCILAHVSNQINQPPNKVLWFTDDCSRTLTKGCECRYPGSTVKPFAAFPGTGTQSSIS